MGVVDVDVGVVELVVEVPLPALVPFPVPVVVDFPPFELPPGAPV